MIEEINDWKMDLIWYERVPSHHAYDNEMYKTEIESLKAVDPRVMVFQGDAGLTLLCWLHKYKMFGPNHAIFILKFSDSNTDTVTVPDFLSDWCSPEMVREILNHTFIFGETNRADIERNISDDTGNTWAEFDNDIQSRVADVEKAVWIYEGRKYLYYDLMLFTGFVLDEAERLLNLQNDSLFNWSIESENFKQNGQFIGDIFKEAIFNVKVVGMRGIYDFDRNSTQNWRGYTPITINQLSTKRDKFDIKLVQVAIYSNVLANDTPRLTIFNDKIYWATPDGKPPFDRVQIKPFEPSIYKFRLNLALIAFTMVGSIILVGFLFHRKLHRILEMNLIVTGIVICNIHIYLLPLRDAEPFAFHCSLLGTFFVLGISIFLLSLWSVLERQLKIISNFAMAIERNKNYRPKRLKMFSKERLILAISIAAITILDISFLLSSPFKSHDMEITPERSFGYRVLDLEAEKSCIFDFNLTSIAFIGIISIFIWTALLKSILICYETNKLKKSIELATPRKDSCLELETLTIEQVPPDFGQFYTFVISLIIGACLVLLLLPKQTYLITAFLSLFLTIGTIFIVYLRTEKDLAIQ